MAPVPAITVAPPAPVLECVVSTPAVPVVEYVTPAPVPVTEYVTQTPHDFFAEPVRAIECVAPALVIGYIAPEQPPVTFSTPSQQFHAYTVAVTTGVRWFICSLG